jgi:Uma2 family endonuclease
LPIYPSDEHNSGSSILAPSSQPLSYAEVMGAQTGVSEQEYLRTSYPDLDREYRDGEIVERSVPDYLHGRIQALLLFLFQSLNGKFPIYPCAETRMKLRTGLYLIPDVAVFYPDEPSLEPRAVPETPPLVVVEILSLDGSLSD